MIKIAFTLFVMQSFGFFEVYATVSETQGKSILKSVYQREFELLTSEKRGLAQQIQEERTKSQSDFARLRLEVERIKKKVTQLRLENDNLEEMMNREVEELELVQDRDHFLQNIISQATTTLQKYKVQVENTDDGMLSTLSTILSQGISLVERLNGLRIERGSFFDRRGSQRVADLLWLSQVGAISLAPDCGGALAPIEGGYLKLIVSEPGYHICSFLDGSGTCLLKWFLFDQMDKASGEVIKDRTLWGSFLAGGVVMWPISLLAFIALVILVERIFVLYRYRITAERIKENLTSMVEGYDWQQAKDKISSLLLNQRIKLERFLSTLGIIAAVAPLLGLLGTVTGMIGTFQVITSHGVGNPQLLSGGISEALLTTQFGLMVAIPVLLMHTVLSGWIDQIMMKVEMIASRLLDKINCSSNNVSMTKKTTRAVEIIDD